MGARHSTIRPPSAQTSAQPTVKATEIRPDRWPRPWRYGLFGGFSAVFLAPSTLALRAAANPVPSPVSWIVTELSQQWLFYGYLVACAALLLFAAGWLAGKREDRLHSDAITDHLTGLFNRRLFDQQLRQQLALRERNGRPLSVLAVDLDDLKVLNDRYGHEAGDSALRALADCLHSSCRATDFLARVGGDEFAVIAPGSDAEQAGELARRIRAHLERRHAGVGAPPFTVSIGIAECSPEFVAPTLADARARFPQPATDASAAERALLRAADRALYEAKQRGRDRTVVAATG
jgi:diguanylate cyclase (GGDEF)-like protein